MDPNPRALQLSLKALRFSTLPEDSSGGHCLHCDAFLDLHQLDSRAPERMMGTCKVCWRWYLIDFDPGEDEAVMIQLPDGGALLKAHVG